MFSDNVVKGLIAQGTFLALGLGFLLFGLMLVKIVEVASKAFYHIHVSTDWWPRLPRLPDDAWKRVSEPAKKVAMKILAIVGVVMIGILLPLLLVFITAVKEGVEDPLAYVTAGAILSAIVITVMGLVFLVKPAGRTSVREIGLLGTLVLYVIAISWLAFMFAMLPLMLISD